MPWGGERGVAARLYLAAALSLAASCQPARDPPADVAFGRDVLHNAVEVAAWSASPEIARFYAARDHRPLWVERGVPTPLARRAAAMLADATADGLNPDDYAADHVAELIAGMRDAAALEVTLSEGVARYLRDLRTPSRAHALGWRDPGLPVTNLTGTAVLERIAAAPDPLVALAEARRMNPLYEALRSARPADAEQHRLRKVNLDRLRALPAELGERYVVVDAASAMLSMVQGGRAVGTMRVVVGKPGMATPTLAGLIRYATLSPYWNLPPDLSAERARRIMAEGPTLLDAQRLEVVSGWQADAQPVDPAQVDWTSLATGQGGMRLRQLPGERNVMGAVKFMLPNPLGIYLHDTPDKWAFDRAVRRLSSGCVRLQDAARLGAWLFGGTMPSPSGIPEERVDLARPVPVYIVYLTAVAEDGRVATRPDPYRRDALS